MASLEHPADALYTREHEWLRLEGDTVTVGITAFAAAALGDIVFVSFSAVGDDVSAGSSLGEVESTKSVSDVYAPVSGQVVQHNDALAENPEIVNADPYGDGWLVRVTVAPDDLDPANFLDSTAYADHTAGAPVKE